MLLGFENLKFCETEYRLNPAVSPQVGLGQHSGEGPGRQAPGNLRNLAFSGYPIEAKNCSSLTYFNFLFVIFLRTNDYFHWDQWRYSYMADENRERLTFENILF